MLFLVVFLYWFCTGTYYCTSDLVVYYYWLRTVTGFVLVLVVCSTVCVLILVLLALFCTGTGCVQEQSVYSYFLHWFWLCTDIGCVLVLDVYWYFPTCGERNGKALSCLLT